MDWDFVRMAILINHGEWKRNRSFGLDHRFGQFRAGLEPAPTKKLSLWDLHGQNDDQGRSFRHDKGRRGFFHGLFAAFLFYIFSLLSTPVFAGGAWEMVVLDAVVVTAEKLAGSYQTGDVDLEQTPGFYSVIEKEAFEGKMEDLSQVIEKEAGIQVRQSGGLGSYSAVSLRGSTSDQVMIYLDGVLLNDASGGGVNLGNISLSDVDSIEIFKGISPVNFSKSSIGGVINIKTPRTVKERQSAVTAGCGSFGTGKVSGFINHKPGRWDYMVSADYLASDNDFEFPHDNRTVYNLNDDYWENRENAQFDQENVLAKAGFDFSDDVRIHFMNQWFSKDQGLPSKWNYDNQAALDTTRNISTLQCIINNIGMKNINSCTQVDYSLKEEAYDDPHGSIGTGGTKKYFYTTKHYDANIFLEWITGMNTLSGGVDFRQEVYDPRDELKPGGFKESDRDTVSLSLQDSLFLFQDKLLLAPALRYSKTADKLMGDVVGNYEVSIDRIRRSETHASPQIGLKYRALKWITLKTNFAEYVREPSFFELLGDRGDFKGEIDLKNEKGKNHDIGVEIDVETQSPFLRRLYCGIACFQNHVDDRIIRIYDARGTAKPANDEEGVIEGIETELKLSLLKFLSLTANATWQDSENESTIGHFNGKKLAGIFHKSFLGRIETRVEGVKIYLECVVEKDMYWDTPNNLKAENKEEINAGLSWLMGPVLLTVEGKNLDDDLYEEYYAHPLPGRAYYATVKYNF